MADLFPQTLAGPAPIKAFSLWQPWGSLVAVGAKPDETRHWSTNYRGLVAICAAKYLDIDGAPHDLCRAALGSRWARDVPRGCVLALTTLTACREASAVVADGVTRANFEAGNFARGRFAWRFENIRALLRPIPVVGRQGLFNWTPPEDLEALLGPVVDHLAFCRSIGWA